MLTNNQKDSSIEKWTKYIKFSNKNIYGQSPFKNVNVLRNQRQIKII